MKKLMKWAHIFCEDVFHSCLLYFCGIHLQNVYKAENRLLFWLLICFAFLIALAILTLLLCCACPWCPLYNATRWVFSLFWFFVIIAVGEKTKRILQPVHNSSCSKFRLEFFFTKSTNCTNLISIWLDRDFEWFLINYYYRSLNKMHVTIKNCQNSDQIH